MEAFKYLLITSLVLSVLTSLVLSFVVLLRKNSGRNMIEIFMLLDGIWMFKKNIVKEGDEKYLLYGKLSLLVTISSIVLLMVVYT